MLNSHSEVGYTIIMLVECVLLSAESFLVSFINTVDNGIVMLLEIRIGVSSVCDIGWARLDVVGL